MDMKIPEAITSNENKVYSGVALRVMKFLGSGCLPIEAARAAGCDESYVSQLKAEPSFMKQVNELVKKTMADQSVIDNNYVEVERILSERLKGSAGGMFGPDQILRTLKFVNEAKKKVPTGLLNPENNQNGAGQGSQTVNVAVLVLPERVAKEFVLNPQNEIIGVGNESLVTLPSQNITKLVEQVLPKTEILPKEVKKVVNKNGSRDPDYYSNL